MALRSKVGDNKKEKKKQSVLLLKAATVKEEEVSIWEEGPKWGYAFKQRRVSHTNGLWPCLGVQGRGGQWMRLVKSDSEMHLDQGTKRERKGVAKGSDQLQRSSCFLTLYRKEAKNHFQIKNGLNDSNRDRVEEEGAKMISLHSLSLSFRILLWSWRR